MVLLNWIFSENPEEFCNKPVIINNKKSSFFHYAATLGKILIVEILL